MTRVWTLLRMQSVAAALLAVAGCHDASPSRDETPHLVVTDVIVHVRNTSRTARQVALESGSRTSLLGEVAGRSARSFSLPSGLGGGSAELRFAARSRGDTIRSAAFRFAPGQRVSWSFGDAGPSAVVAR